MYTVAYYDKESDDLIDLDVNYTSILEIESDYKVTVKNNHFTHNDRDYVVKETGISQEDIKLNELANELSINRSKD